MDDTERENTWAALRIIRETVETLGPPGLLPSREVVLTRDGPEPVHEGQAIAEALLTNMKDFDVMQALYDSEVTVRAEPDGCWDNGFRAQIGDDQNGWQEPIIYAPTWGMLMTRLALHAEQKYPESRFAEQIRLARERHVQARRAVRRSRAAS